MSDSDDSDAGLVEATIYEQSDDSAMEDGSDSDDAEEGEAPAAAATKEDEEEEESDGVDEEALLAGIKGSDSEASESEGEDEDEFSKGGAKINLDDDEASAKILARVRKLSRKKAGPPGVVYLGRVPHGFYEEQMAEYFKQFGVVKRLRLARNPTTGRSRHYAFVEFMHPGVARIVAETMDNYLMFDRLLKCKVVPEDKVHPRLFADRRRKPMGDFALRRHQAAMDAQRTPAAVSKQVDRLVKAEQKKRVRLAAADIDYDFPGYEALRPPRAKHTKFA
ncbi:nucleolar protein [Coemansia helicoidea]|uniref:Nucleolar protein n=1 Tax=Coemansia helicoidea TaxID=1286919 RepID=A0ACC1LCV1_9FUNG|nr:nucleolar protein [Coemansia helicoidea]